jgi:hypothetical protein
MPVIFAKNTGRVIAVEDKVAAGAFQLGNVTGEGGGITYRRHNTIITRIGISAAGNYQFLHTIGNDVYVYVFGDRMGQVQLHGLSFMASEDECSGATGPHPTPHIVGAGGTKHGFELLFEWYTTNRIAARRDPVRVTIGRDTNFKGFVTAVIGDVQDALHRTIQFQMTISLLPDVIPSGS